VEETERSTEYGDAHRQGVRIHTGIFLGAGASNQAKAATFWEPCIKYKKSPTARRVTVEQKVFGSS